MLLLFTLVAVNARGAGSQPAVDAHVAAAKAAAGEEYKALFDRLCTPPAPPPPATGGHATSRPRPDPRCPTAPSGTPSR